MEATQMISALRGTPITIFFMLCAMGGRAGVMALAENTGYNRKSVSAGLGRLVAFLLVAKMYRYEGWTVTKEGQTFLMAVLNPRGVDKLPLPIISSNINLIDNDIKESINTTSVEIPPPEIHTLLKEAGIGEPKRTELALMDHVTLEYAEAYLASGEDLALIIWKMERNHDAPELPAEPDYKPCKECGKLIWALTYDAICDDCEEDAVEH